MIAESVREVVAVYKLDFGVPEAIWVFNVKEFPGCSDNGLSWEKHPRGSGRGITEEVEGIDWINTSDTRSLERICKGDALRRPFIFNLVFLYSVNNFFRKIFNLPDISTI